MSHPASCKNPDTCTLSYAAHLRGFATTAAATPSRGGAADVIQTNTRERRWARDHAAFKRLKAEGLQPPHLDGAAMREKQGETKYDIEHRQVDVDFTDPK